MVTNYPLTKSLQNLYIIDARQPYFKMQSESCGNQWLILNKLLHQQRIDYIKDMYDLYNR